MSQRPSTNKILKGMFHLSDLINLRKYLCNFLQQGPNKSFSINPNDWSEFVTYEPITDANFQDAVNLWFSDEANATYTYGHISDWNVSLVTDMSEAFRDRTSFDENITDWDVSKCNTV